MLQKILRVTALSVVACITIGELSTLQVLDVTAIVIDDRTSVPLAGVRIVVSSEDTLKTEVSQTADGQFVVPSFGQNPFTINAEKASYLPLEVELQPRVRASSSQKPIVLRMLRRGVIAGRIPGAHEGRVIAIEAVPINRRPRVISGVVDGTGEFRLFDLPSGRFMIGAMDLRNEMASMPRGLMIYPTDANPEVQLVGDTEQNVQFDVSERPSIDLRGRVLSDEAKSVGGVLTLVDSAHPSIVLSTRLFATGKPFVIDHVMPGSYELLARTTGRPEQPSLFARKRVVVQSGPVQETELVLRPGHPVDLSFAGSDTSCGSPGTLDVASLDAWRPEVKVNPVVTNSTRPPLVFLPPGLHEVRAKDKTDRCRGDLLLEIPETATSDTIKAAVVLRPPSRVFGEINRPDIEAVVLLDLTPGRESAMRVKILNSAREYSFAHVEQGLYSVRAVTHPVDGNEGRWAAPSTFLEPAIRVPSGTVVRVDIGNGGRQ